MVCQTPDTELTAENGVYTMVIHGVSADMTGTIKCTAYNKVRRREEERKRETVQMGEISTSGPLKVTAPVPVEFETSLCDATCREGDTLKLKVTPILSSS